MKKSYLCTGLALACALTLSACGGSKNNELQIAMTLAGVTQTGLQITNKGGPAVAVPPGAGFAFTDLVPIDTDYDIAIVARPLNTESCAVINGKGNTGVISPPYIAITCVLKKFELSGGVSGLTGGDLVINNGSQTVTILKGATSFTLSAPTATDPKFGQIAEGVPYGLTILKQPASGTCTIAYASGIMPAAAVNNIAISCTP